MADGEESRIVRWAGCLETECHVGYGQRLRLAKLSSRCNVHGDSESEDEGEGEGEGEGERNFYSCCVAENQINFGETQL